VEAKVGNKWVREVTYRFFDIDKPGCEGEEKKVKLYSVLVEVEDMEEFILDYFDDSHGYRFSVCLGPDDFDERFGANRTGAESKLWRPYDGDVYESVERKELVDLNDLPFRESYSDDLTDPVSYYLHISKYPAYRSRATIDGIEYRGNRSAVCGDLEAPTHDNVLTLNQHKPETGEME